MSPEDVVALADTLMDSGTAVQFIKGFVSSGDSWQGSRVEDLRAPVLGDFQNTVFLGRTYGNPPKRCEFGEAEIELYPGAIPVKQRPYPLTGDRRKAWVELTD